MDSLSGFLQHAYWWLSLVGGVHCAVLAVLLGWKRLSQNRHQQIIVIAIFITLSVYFLTGIVNRENAPLPIHIILALMTPMYFLLMPLVYFYCKNELDCQQRYSSQTLMLHYAPAIIVATLVVLFSITHFSSLDFIKSEAVTIRGLNHFSLLGMVLPVLLFIQTAIYFIAIIQVIRRKRNREGQLVGSEIDDLKVRWLLVLATAIIVNWLFRCLLASFTFIFGDQYWLIIETVIRFNLLMTLYILAIYRLQQLTVIAYQNGLIAQHRDKTEKAITEVLDREEKDYLSSILKDKGNK